MWYTGRYMQESQLRLGGGECEEEWEVSSGNELGEPWYVVGLVWFATECREHMG